MNRLTRRLLLLAGLLLAPLPGHAACPAALDFSLRPLTGGEPQRLCDAYAGKVLLLVNTASLCVFTPQYGGLEQLGGRYAARGFAVLGFPSNDFGNQEPGDAGDIAKVCRVDYGTSFPMFEKIRVRGANAHPLYKYLAAESGKSPAWNFHKYLIARDGRVVASIPSHVSPEDSGLRDRIEQLLAEPVSQR
jgi:glutathione peroxidase